MMPRAFRRYAHRPWPAALLALFALAAAGSARAETAGWWGFRGDGGSVTTDAPPPLTWSVDQGENIAWQADLPGRGVSGPIVVRDQVIVTCSSGARSERLHVLAFDRTTGKPSWHRQFWATGRTLFHPTSAVAANTPVSDGERIFAFFSSNDLYALDLEGNVLWMRGLTLTHPLAGNDVGMSSSPVVAGGAVIVQSEAHAESFVEAIDVRTGETQWSDERPRGANWCSPVAFRQQVAGDDVDVVLLQAGESVELRRAEDGQRLWRLSLPCESIPSAVVADRIYVPSGGLRAISWDGASESPAVAWHDARLQPGSPSPVVHDGCVYVINGAGVLTCGDIGREEVAWKLRLGGRFWATPVAAGDYLYCINADGKAFVVELGEKGRIVAENDFGDEILASPAASDGALYVRSHRRLWKIAE